MSTYIPFNFQPVSVTTRTGSYTIPTGFYAYVAVQCEAGGTFSINSTVALSGLDIGAAGTDSDVIAVSAEDTQAGSTVATVQTTVGTDYYFDGFVMYNDGAAGASYTLDVGGVTIASGAGLSNNTPFYVKAGAGDTIQLSSSGGGGAKTVKIVGYRYRSSSPNEQQDQHVSNQFWVPEGTQLSETGTTRYTVSLYNNIA
jgi:hypothetical protein